MRTGGERKLTGGFSWVWKQRPKAAWPIERGQLTRQLPDQPATNITSLYGFAVPRDNQYVPFFVAAITWSSK